MEKSDEKIDFSIDDLREELGCSSFNLLHFGSPVGRVEVSFNGSHNIQNCLIAIAVSKEVGLTFEQIIEGLKDFDGVGRRLEVLRDNKKHLIIDDYGHHPTEVETTINAVNCLKKEKELVVIFEPHRYSRTHNCWNDFLGSFKMADLVYILPIYAAGEDEIEGVNSNNLVKELKQENPAKYNLATNLESVLGELSLDEQIILTMGAGKIGRDIREYVEVD